MFPIDEIFNRATPEPNSGCWLWDGHTTNGYGNVSTQVNGRQVRNRAHRAAYEAVNGQIPAGKMVCHKCDVKSCVNPAHLFIGTHDDNMADLRAKGYMRGRVPRGEMQGAAKLTADIVAYIRRSNEPQSALARKFGVHQVTVSKIKLRKAWAHVA